MSVFTTCRIADPFGVHKIEVANYQTLDYILNCSPGGVGILELTLPISFNKDLLLKDSRIGAWRSINGGSPYHDNGAIYLLKTVRYSATSIFVRAYHANWIAGTRVIGYNAGTTYTAKVAAPADDQIKAFWRENFGAGIVAVDRDGVETQADISAYVSVQGNVGAGASVAESGTRRNFASIATELCDASATAGTYLTYEIFAPTESTLELRTYSGQRGYDHGSTSGQPVILSESRANLENTAVTIDYSGEKTFIIAGGQGQQDLRIIVTSLDLVRMGTSPFGRIEDFLDMSNTSNSTTLQDQADSALRDNRPVTLVEGTLIETPKSIRGIHYDLGDILIAEDPQTRQRFDVRLDLVHEHIDRTSKPAGQSLTAHQKTVRLTKAGLRSLT